MKKSTNKIFYRMILLFLNNVRIHRKNKNIFEFGNSIAYKSKIIALGNNNEIIIKDNCRLKNTLILVNGNNNKIIIDNSVRINYGTICLEGDNNSVIIEQDVLIFGKTEIAALEGTNVTIGKDSMFSSNIIIRTGDSHSIIDLNTKNRINKSQDIKIGNHVWITEGVTILKGSEILDNSVIAAKAVVNSKFDESNIVIGGIPAKILKRDIDWNFDKI